MLVDCSIGGPIRYGEAHEDEGYLVAGCKQQEADGEDEKAATGRRGDLTSISIRQIILREESTQM